jgi:hypothetical protein
VDSPSASSLKYSSKQASSPHTTTPQSHSQRVSALDRSSSPQPRQRRDTRVSPLRGGSWIPLPRRGLLRCARALSSFRTASSAGHRPRARPGSLRA